MTSNPSYISWSTCCTDASHGRQKSPLHAHRLSLSQIRSDLSMYSTCLPLARMRFSFFLIFAVRIGEPIVHVGSEDTLS